MFFTGLARCAGTNKLAVDFEAVGGVEDDLLGDDELVGGKIVGLRFRRQSLKYLVVWIN